MTEFLVRHFVKDYEEIRKGVRPYGLRCAGQCGGHLSATSFLFLVKGAIGIFAAEYLGHGRCIQQSVGRRFFHRGA